MTPVALIICQAEMQNTLLQCSKKNPNFISKVSWHCECITSFCITVLPPTYFIMREDSGSAVCFSAWWLDWLECAFWTCTRGWCTDWDALCERLSIDHLTGKRWHFLHYINKVFGNFIKFSIDHFCFTVFFLLPSEWASAKNLCHTKSQVPQWNRSLMEDV